MRDNLYLPDGVRILGHGWYEQRYVSQADGWRIAACTLVRSKILFTPAPPAL
ncbi:hypothetical protein [uncultured Sphingomonas sp.]|uniref:hypothetical protein n=1 Tax=uncultured Sphingomonas sp. TaxID=158754 RepID=UPI0026299197|nr:hypothetical protein [uncultured Sphingomonas sp.]